ncbi:MAG: hypothetical protein KTR23_18980 [Rhodospirillales bacterium]|nr:hypothetical protein [Rhodospirillales bacterium]
MKVFNRLGFVSVLLVSIFLINKPAMADVPTLSFSASVKMPFSNDENTGFEDRILSELFCRLGYKVRVHFVEAERALHELSAGSDDGALGRVHGVTASYPGILEIPEQAFVREFVTYTKPGVELEQGWSGLDGKIIGYVRGWKIVENNVPDGAQKIVVPTGRQLFKMLDKGRIDVAIFNKWGGLAGTEKLRND